MASGIEVVEVEGLTELRRHLKELGPKLPRELGKANKKAAELVAADARSKATALGGSAAKGSPSIKASAAATRVQVSMGGAGFPFAIGAFLGSKQYKQFPPWKGGLMVGGYAVFPAVQDTKDEFLEVYGDLLDDLLHSIK